MKMLDLGGVAATHLERVASEVRNITFSEPIKNIGYLFSELNDPSSDRLKTSINQSLVKDCLSIYSFHLDDNCHETDFKTAFENARKENLANLAYPRINTKTPPAREKCLYVGTSRQTPKRLLQHLGFGNDRTYSLQLKKWAGDLAGGFQIRIVEFKVSEKQRSLLTYLEDALASDLHPMLGRRGNL
jgi:hypothetical protein